MRVESPSVIGLTGYAGVGKDLVAALLAMQGYKRLAFADLVREEVVRILESKQIPPEYPAAAKALLHRVKVRDVWRKPTSDAMRGLLQFHGTEFRRGQDESYWLQQMALKQKLNFLAGRYVISDVRFPNEVEMVRAQGGVVWRIRRPKMGRPSKHVSERGQKGLQVDQTIDNDVSLPDLAQKVLALLPLAVPPR